MRPDGGGMPFPLILGTLGWHFRARRIVDEGAEIKSDEITALDAAMTLLSHTGGRWRGASKPQRWI